MEKKTYRFVLPVGMSPADIEKIVPELEYALQGLVEVSVSGKCVDICVYKGALSDNIKYHLPDLTGYTLGVPLGYARDGLKILDLGDDGTPYLLVAGPVGMGKSTILNTLIYTLLKSYTPDDVQLFLVDMKLGCEFNIYRDDPHTAATCFDPAENKLITMFDNLNEEIRDRMVRFTEAGVKDIIQYRDLGHKLPFMLLVIDEYFEIKLMDKEVEQKLLQILMIGRSAGLRCAISSCRPVSEVLNSSIKSLMAVRCCLKVADRVNSEVVLDIGGAEKLPNIKGRFYCLMGPKLIQIQAMHL